MLTLFKHPFALSLGNSDAIHLAGVLFVLLLLFLIAEMWRILLNPPTEWTRKFVHIGFGIIIACFHWIFESTWPVCLLVLLLTLGMIIVRKFKLFPSVYAVQRTSWGDLYFLISAFFLFLISNDQPVFYFISILTLTVSDALAAVMGSIYKKATYIVETETKSLEGSSTFFLSTFLIVHLPLLLMTNLGRLQSVMIALQISFVVTCLEAICLNGLDNIMIPIATYYLLFKLLPMSPEGIAWELTCQLLILATLNFISLRFKFISFSGAIAVLLFLYGAFIFGGGSSWLVVPLLCVGIFALAEALTDQETGNVEVYQVITMFYVNLIPTLLFLVNAIANRYLPHEFQMRNQHFSYVLFIGSFAALLPIALYHMLGNKSKRLSFKYLGITGLAFLCYCFLIPFGLWVHVGAILPLDLLISFVVVATGYHVYYFFFRHSPLLKKFPWQPRLQALSVLCGVLLAIPFYLLMK